MFQFVECATENTIDLILFLLIPSMSYYTILFQDIVILYIFGNTYGMQVV